MKDSENKFKILIFLRGFFSKAFEAFISFLEKYWVWIIPLVLLVLSVLVRIPFYPVRTSDYNVFLSSWYEEARKLGGKEYLASGIGDYGPMYNYFLVIFASLGIEAGESNGLLFALKITSDIFVYLSAFLVFFLSKFILKKSDEITVFAFAFSLFTPTILLNSPYWGQCDAIYAFFCLLSLTFLLLKKPYLSAVFFGLSFAFKLQSVFFAPVFLILWLRKGFKLHALLLSAVVYFLSLVPSLACGRSLSSCLGVYFEQTKEYGYLSANAPNMYIFVQKAFAGGETVEKAIVPGATIIGLTFIGLASFFAYRVNKDFDVQSTARVALLMAALCPFVLPKMHERYFYLADIIAVVFFIANPKKFYIPILIWLGSFSGYVTFLFKNDYFGDSNVNLMIGALFILAAIVLLWVDMLKNNSSPKETENRV